MTVDQDFNFVKPQDWIREDFKKTTVKSDIVTKAVFACEISFS